MYARDDRERITLVLIRTCPRRELGECSYFGPGGDCASCMYPWDVVANELLHESAQILEEQSERRRARALERRQKGSRLLLEDEQ